MRLPLSDTGALTADAAENVSAESTSLPRYQRPVPVPGSPPAAEPECHLPGGDRRSWKQLDTAGPGGKPQPKMNGEAEATSGSQHLNYQPDFSENKVYLFNYESILVSGLPEKGLARAGIRIKSKVEISGIGPKLCLIRIHSIEAAEYNGVWPTSSFSRSLKLTQVLTGELRIPIKFEYSNGRVGNLMAPDSVSDDALNIYRGILNVLELSLKKMQHSYSLQEAGIGGICNTTYTIQENKRANLVYVTKSKDLNSCEEKVQLVTGSAYTQPCRTCQQRNKNSQATATYNYKIKYTRNEVVITQADVEEIHQFAPFNEITGGNAIVEARQKLALTDVQKQMAEVPPKEFQDRGSLQYQFGSELLQLPVHLFKIKNVESQIEESLQDLVETTSEQLPRDAPAKALKLMHLFRAANEDNYESVWKQFSSRPVYRRYILDIIPAVASHRALRFLRHKMERQELTNWEAAQTVLVALHSSTPTQDTMEEATLIVKKHCPRSSTVLGKVCYLSYASLCHKQCSSSDSCSECLQLLHGFAGEALSKSNTEEISLALKALGNVGHPASIKHIKKFLPGYATGASDLPLKVHATAVMALKNIGMKDPKMVQAITLEIFLNQKLHPRVRMLAAVVLLETKPGLPILMTLADAVLKEPSMQVASFIYSHLRALGRSTAPDLQAMASACRMAIRALSAKFDRSGYQFSKVFCFSMFKEILMSGLAAKYLVLNNVGSLIPTMAMSQLRTHFLGRIADPLEVGITVEGLQEIFAKGYSPDRDWETDYDFKEILKTLSDWKAFSSDKPFASGYLKMFGQELFFGGLDKNAIQNALQAWYGPEEKIPSIRKIISSLQSGVGRQWTKALLSSEIRRIVPTCTGFPTETSFYYSSITKVAGNVQAQITPSPKSDFRLTELLNANIRLRSKMSLSMAKEMTFVMGINTHMIQAGLEAHTKINAHVPVNVVATVQMKEKNIKIEIPPCKDETNIITLRSKTFAVTRNIGDLAASKMTPVLLPEAVPDIMKMSFDSDSASGETDNIRDRQSAEDASLGISFGHSSSRKEPFVQSVCSNANTFGVQVCIERKSIHAAFIKNVPLYYLVGEHALRMSFKPVYTEAPIEKIQVTIQAGDQAPTKMVRLVTFEDPEARVPSRKETLKRVKKILDDTDDQGTRKAGSSSSSASSTSGSAESTTSSPSSSDSDNRASQGGTQINLKTRQSKAKEKKFYPFGDSGGSSSISSSGSSSGISSSKSSSSSSKSSSNSGSSSSKSSSSSSSSKNSSSNSSSSSKSSSSSSKSSSSSSSSKSSSSNSSKGSSSSKSQSSSSKGRSSSRSSSSSSSSTGSSSSSKAPGIKQKAKKRSKTTPFPLVSAPEGERSVREQKRKTQSSSSSSRSTSSGISSSSKSTGASHRHSKYDRQAEMKRVKSQFNSHSNEVSTEWEYHLPKVYRLRFRSAKTYWHPDRKISSSSSSSSSEVGSSHSNSSSSSSSHHHGENAGHSSKRRHVSRGDSSHHSRGCSLVRECNFLGDVIPPGITIVAQAVRSDNRNQGYQATAYVHSDAAKVDVQLVVVQLAETNWKACADAVILPLKAQARLRWGKECQDYKIAATATTGKLARKPAVQLKVQWGNLPSWIKKTSTAFMKYVPGAALVLGFSEAHQRNPSREVIVRVAATSPRTIDTVIKAPGVTLYYQALRMPFVLPLGPSPTYETRDITAWNLFPEIASQIAQEDQSTCEVREGDFKTFDHMSHTYSFNKSCSLIVAQDCTEHPKFIITTRNVDPQSFSREVHINTPSANIAIYPAANSSLLVACNEEPVLSHSRVSEYEKNNVKISKNETTVIVEAPTHGLKKVTFDGVILKITVASWMRGRTCGICGNNDREKHNELLMPNHKLAHSCSAFVHSWVLLEESCSGGCKLQRSYVKLNRNPTVDGEESMCYSVDPVLKCMKDCTPIKKTSVKVGFHCFPKDTSVSLLEWQRSSDKKSASEDVVESVDADIDCTCTGDCS
ncbi:vitellogenin-1-like [Strigops habroptila]|uniref:vitellogenin-1-like n=1 Tax=Strigops habroptila TaxID=2489341 RepID=UPI0011CEE6AB|nr:vitellogenin-1-like [Strigops habroptila]